MTGCGGATPIASPLPAVSSPTAQPAARRICRRPPHPPRQRRLNRLPQRPRRPTASPTQSPSPVPPTATEPAELQLMAVGDLMLGRLVGDRMSGGRAGRRLCRRGPGAARGRHAGRQPGMRDYGCGSSPAEVLYVSAPPGAAPALADAGVDVVGLANNHSLDYGIDGLADMLARLRENGIEWAGAGADAAAARAPVILDAQRRAGGVPVVCQRSGGGPHRL